MRELVELEVNDDIAAQEPVVEDEIHEVMILVEGESLLAGLEQKTFAEFQ